jgi:flagellar basal-body rod protein FlgC
MSLDNIFGIGGSALNAQTIRMNAVASNLANAGTVAGSETEAFRGKRAVFKAIMEKELNGNSN